MKNLLLSLLIISISPTAIFAQSKVNVDAKYPPNTFRSPDNPNYWGNKKPYTDYWQQDVYYRIDAKINEQTDIVSATENLTYWNNSPDTLEFVYFHLYQNAFQPGSYYDNLIQNNGVKPNYGPYEAARWGTIVDDLKVNGIAVRTELDNTILKVMLPSPLYPGGSIEISMDFETYYDGSGGVRRRMKTFNTFGFKQYNGCHWYPRIAVYDHKFGWTVDQHLGREFYGDFGTFDVKLTFAHDYIVEATGFLQNRTEMLPDDLRKKLDMKNFADKPWNSAPSTIIKRKPGETKTWHYYAENVHDFAFTANPLYRIGEAEWNGIKCYSLAIEPHAAGWQNAADYTAEIIKVFSEDIGMYQYHKMIVADARDGMEYPMLTLDGGKDPSYRGLLVHEVGHNWFYGMVNNNESYRAALDEGFTQFLTAHGLERIDGKNLVRNFPKQKYAAHFTDSMSARDSRAYYGYHQDAMHCADHALNTHSDQFGGKLRHGGGYRHVYVKTATMLYNLQYVLGDELFLNSIQHYFNKWSFCHPYFEDMRKSFMEAADADLNWFFDQWLETTKNIDYKVKSIKKAEDQVYEVTLERLGRMQMPIDLQIEDGNGQLHNFYIPNTYFRKNTNATTLPQWTGWDNLHPTYTFDVAIPAGIEQVTIDPTKRLADVNYLNNSSSMAVDFGFDSKIWNLPSRTDYDLNWRPDIWYNSFDGIKTGIHLNGNYMRTKHRLYFTLWGNTRLAQNLQDDIPNRYQDDADVLSFNLKYQTRIDKWIKKGTFLAQVKFLDGLNYEKIGLSKTFENNTKASISLISLYRRYSSDLVYLLYPAEWQAGRFNNSINLALSKGYKMQSGKGDWNVNLRSSSLLSDFNYAYLDAELNNQFDLWKLLLKTRAFGRLGSGQPARESALYFAGSNPEEMMGDKFIRSKGFVPNDWVGDFGDNVNHFQDGGGLNMRGFAGYYIVETDKDGTNSFAYKGRSGAAINAELEFQKISPIKFKKLARNLDLRTYLFGDAGSISYQAADGGYEFSQVRFDAGIGSSLSLTRFGRLSGLKPLTLRFDVPFYLSHTPATDPDNLKFRWLFGVNRAF